MGDNSEGLIEGYGTKESPLVKDLLASDSRPLSYALQQEGNYRPAPAKIPFSTYYDKDYAEQEMEHVWKKCWQFACREEDIPNVGDRYVYDVGPLSFIIIRSGENEFKALYNACLHRGTRLCSAHSGGDEIRCPFHGWQWHVDGSVKEIPGQWDFPQVDETFRLPEAQIASWGGCLFINPDQDAAPLEDSLGVLKEHFEHFDMGKRFTLVKTAKKIRANWKNVWAAFLEAYHVAETHFDAVDFNGDANTKYDIFDNGVTKTGRLITPAAVPSPGLNDAVTAREAAIEAAKSFANALGPAAEDTLPDFDKIPDFGRKHVAEWRRETMKAMLGVDLSEVSDSEMLDATQYDMFPNFGAWLGEGLPLMYQFLPLGDDPNESLFVVRLLAPVADESQRPPAAPMTELDFDEFFESLPQWGRIAHVFDQDMSNLPIIQKGMHSAAKERSDLVLGRYQEQRIALMHEFLEEQISGK
jgi:phenylpropionate dioxygenase-like ring-hydroxylating dioxygenase large terminal subunit